MIEKKTLVRGGTVVSMDSNIGTIDKADVLISGDRIARVGKDIKAPDAAVIDATNMIVSPGYVDTHRHVWQTQLRTVATDWSLFDYFVQMRSIYSGFYNPEDAYLGNYIGALEALNAGITTLVDHSHIMNSPDHSDEAVRGLKDSGVRGIFCYGLFGNPLHWTNNLTEQPDGWRYDDARRIRRDTLASDDDLLVFGFAPTEVTVTDFETTCSEIAFAREVEARRISCHVSMGNYDAGLELVRRIGEAGLMNEDLLFVHGATLTDRELQWMADHGAAVSATPETELQMGMGHPVAVRAKNAGVRTSLGIDIVSNYSGDMQAQMRLLLQAQRGFENSQIAGPLRDVRFKAREVLDMATMGGATALGWESRIGSLTPGKQADLVLTSCEAINMVPCIDPIGALVLNANVSDVDSVFVAGKQVKKDGKLVGINWEDLARQLRQSSNRIVEGFDTIDKQEIENAAASVLLEPH
jgi:cytosine/adenosine deaminase-related metal-dependent hydrolase